MEQSFTHVIFNPAADGDKARELYVPLNLVLCKRLGKNYAFHTTFKSGEAAIICRNALRDGAGLVIAAGDEGTVNEVINGFFIRGNSINPNCCLGILDCGKARKLTKFLGLPESLDDQFNLIFSNREKHIGLGAIINPGSKLHFPERFFLSECRLEIKNGGIFIHNTSDIYKSPSILIDNSFSKRNNRSPDLPIQLRYAGKYTMAHKGCEILVRNGSFLDIEMKISPSRVCSGNNLMFHIIKKRQQVHRLSGLMNMFPVIHALFPEYRFLKTDYLGIDSPARPCVVADGDNIGTTPIYIKLLPEILKVKL